MRLGTGAVKSDTRCRAPETTRSMIPANPARQATGQANLVQQASEKPSMRQKHWAAGWDDDFLTSLIAQQAESPDHLITAIFRFLGCFQDAHFHVKAGRHSHVHQGIQAE